MRIQGIDIENILLTIIIDFKSTASLSTNANCMTLEDINVLFKLLLKPVQDITISEQETTCLNKIWDFMARQDCSHLLKLLVKNHKNNLLPPTDIYC